MNHILFLSMFLLFAFSFMAISFIPFRKKWIILTLNLCFLLACYVSISMILGRAKPVEGIPLYNHENWDGDNTYVVGGYWNDKTIYLLVKEEDEVITYSWPISNEFLDRIKQTQSDMLAQSQGAERWGFKLRHNESGRGNDIPELILPPAQDPIEQGKPGPGENNDWHNYKVD